MKVAAGLYAFSGGINAHFTLTGNLNLKNCAHWADNNKHDVFASPLHDEKMTVWCNLMNAFTLGSYFFEEKTDICKRVQNECSLSRHVN